MPEKKKKKILDDLPKVSDTIRSLRDFFMHPQAVLQVLLAARAAFDLVFSFHLLFRNSTFLALRCNEGSLFKQRREHSANILVLVQRKDFSAEGKKKRKKEDCSQH